MDIAYIKKLLSNASDGEWNMVYHDGDWGCVIENEDGIIATTEQRKLGAKFRMDAEFIASSKDIIKYLLLDKERLEKEIADYKKGAENMGFALTEAMDHEKQLEAEKRKLLDDESR